MTGTISDVQAPQSNKTAYDGLRDVVAGGVSSNMRARGVAAPLVVDSAAGARIRDVEGNELIDANMGYGPHIFGYADRDVTEHVAARFRCGHLTGLPHRLDHEAAELVAELVPGVEQLRFANSGTEALMSAVRLARTLTGRTLVLTFGGHYHGWSETLLRTRECDGYRPRPLAPGMIPEAMAHTLQVGWNDAAAVEAVFEEHGGELAAVLCEPVLANAGVVAPAPGFLELLRERTRSSGALLVFDEVITGFRVSRGGAQELYGVVPDLTVLSKVMGGGFPVAAFGGPRQAMKPLAQLEAFHAGVYAGNHAAMAAVAASLAKVRSLPGLYTELEALGAYAEARVHEAAAAAQRTLQVRRVGSVMSVALTSPATGAVDPDGHRRLQIACQGRGVYFHPIPDEPWFLSTAHTRSDIDTIADVLAESLAEVCAEGAR
ncbi:aspartate aminotransferase family protein [Streptomonospora nanhaiensis]|uniref:aspartate aminotransferase family protein n=1 Tax=Streptomonospora nanhaiensis TaxID=1323731 RepID=UPI001C990F42|nr:aminotransferase class III-fold pyridoxal phosphate-dependent enzyme [Streptomonospora nanhaiensis]MBX9389734.1 aminotransferase class III-fold pyridoxal phosphate-dependent enzyme [Streptomonospora nanhaiensis]